MWHGARAESWPGYFARLQDLELVLDAAKLGGKGRALPAQEGAVGLSIGASPFTERIARRVHRELLAEGIDLVVEELGRGPAAEKDSLARHLRGDVGVPVAISTDPGAEANRARVDGKAAARLRLERSVETPQEDLGTACQSDCSKTASPPRTSSVGVGRLRCSSSVCQTVEISLRSCDRTASCSSGVRSFRSPARSASAMRLYRWRSVRRITWVGCAVSTNSTCCVLAPRARAPGRRPRRSSLQWCRCRNQSRGSTACPRAALIWAVRLSRTLCRCSAVFASVRKREKARTTSPTFSVGRAVDDRVKLLERRFPIVGMRFPEHLALLADPLDRLVDIRPLPAVSRPHPAGLRERERPLGAPHRVQRVDWKRWQVATGGFIAPSTVSCMPPPGSRFGLHGCA